MRCLLPLALGIAACKGGPGSVNPDPLPDPENDADVFVDVPGDPIPGLDSDTLALYEQGRVVIERVFSPYDGVGPTLNTDSCAGCHQFPAPGGSGPRYRDFFLCKTERWDGAMVDAGSNGASPVRNLYATAPAFHVAEPEDTSIYARRNTPSGLGVGLFAFVSDDDILASEDPDDADGDGISGRVNWESGRPGRFGYKSQASTLESFNRGAFFNQMGITTDPLFYQFEDEPPRYGDRRAHASLLDLLGSAAWAQVAATDQPTTDDDGVDDPEVSNADQEALLVYSTYLGVPRPSEPDEAATRGAGQFRALRCDGCHVPRLSSTLGALPAYSDLLVHDMGPELADGLTVGLASGSEFRTQPLWGVVLHGPFLHDGRADTLQEAIEWHGGEAEDSVDAWLGLSQAEQDDLLSFLSSLGGSDPQGQVKTFGEARVPDVGEPGGPDGELSADEQELWELGRRLFDYSNQLDDGLGTFFNADSCRACHQDPVLGGAGGYDTSVLRIGHRSEETGEYSALDRPVMPRQVVWGDNPFRMPGEANVIELRNPPTTLGVGLVDGIDSDAILANEDPDDSDGDGISGRARILADGRVGRFGWKAQVPSVADFAADALLNEVGLTVDPALSDFTSDDDGDALADPELSDGGYEALVFYLSHLGPPVASGGEGQGRELFDAIGCGACHLPELDGVPLYSDLLVHDVATELSRLVDAEDGLLATEFRTPPLWGVADTAPYLHDGTAPTLSDAVVHGHGGEAAEARDAFEALSGDEQDALLRFLESL